ncbi:MAG: SHOCT domain-containing protein [Acidimicrobiales bacterium]
MVDPGARSPVQHPPGPHNPTSSIIALRRPRVVDTPLWDKGFRSLCQESWIRKLGDLRAAGILTEDEFVEKKAEMLKRL